MTDLQAWERGNWRIDITPTAAGNLGLKVSNLRTWLTEYPVRYDDGRIAYDWPERIPAYVKRHVERLYALLPSRDAIKAEYTIA